MTIMRVAIIFKLLPEDLRKEIFLLVGKKILYLSTEIYEFKLNKPGNHENLKLKNIPKDILETLKDEVAECSIFATVVDKNRMNNDIFNCQIFWPPNQEPKLIIHCIQKKFKERKCKLKIMIMITGYDMNFNFDRPDFNIQFKVEKNDWNKYGPIFLKQKSNGLNGVIIKYFAKKDLISYMENLKTK
uniref:DUF7431 domain-containing protein n=1 Tax=Rhizophagus irregularis (strain DAOM 181602 / DAOM 197198 / MUCL 43194) TaxID=747089 RepID=U9SWT2_RHIID